MAYRDAVRYIEDMNPTYVKAVGDECRHTTGIIKAALPTMMGLPGKVEWKSDASDLYEQRLKETIELVEGLYDGFDKAGLAVTDYAQAQLQAKARLGDGLAAEQSLKVLIADIVATQSLTVRFADPLRQWNDLRSTTGVTDWLIEFSQRDAIDKVRDEAESLWHRATTAYEDALRLESDARRDAIDRLRAAYRLLPDFLANSTLSAQIIDATPGLEDSDAGKYRIGPPTAPSLTFDNDFPYDPNASATPADYVSWEKWMLKLRAGQAFRSELDDATAAYAHYMGGTGTDLHVDYDEAYNEDANIRTAVDNEIRSAQLEAERIIRETGQTGFQMTGDPTSARSLSGAPYPASTENWQKTLGDHTIYGTSEVVVNGNQVTMKITVHAEDMYNFNKDMSDIATGAPDDENGRFSTLGWAKEFRTYGELERTVTWTIGDVPGGSVTGGDGTDRNAPGEDRADGRDDG